MIRRNSARPRQRLSCIAVLLLGVGLLPATVAVAPPAGAAPASTPAAAIAAETGLFTPLPTARVFDGTATTAPRQVQIAGQGGVPTSATAVMVNTEVFAPTAAGYVRVTPAGLDAGVATQEFTRGQAISNLVAVKLVNGRIQVKVSAGTARILMDVAGYYQASTGAPFTPLPTARVFDGTATTAPRQVQIADLGGVPAEATAVLVNTEVFAPTAAGYVRVTPAGLDAGVATQEFTRGQAISNLVAVKLVNGRIQVKVSAGTARILMDVAGYYQASTGAPFTPLPTARVFDGTATTAPRQVQLADLGGVPADATAVLVNTEVFAPTAVGYVRVTPATLDASVAVQEFTRGQAISNLVAVKLVGGRIQVKVSAGTARILMDISGYYSAVTPPDTTAPGPVTGLTASAPSVTTIKLTWTNPTDADFAGVKICRAQGATAPSSSTCTAVTTIAQPGATYTDVRLTPANQYSYAVFANDAVPNYSAAANVTASTSSEPDTTPPGPPTNLVALATSATSIFVSWTNPADADLAGVSICRGTGPAPPPSGCAPIATIFAPESSYLDNTLAPGTAYRYALFSFDTSGNVAIDPDASAGTPPADVPSITGTARNHKGKPIANVIVDVFNANGKPNSAAGVRTGADGTYTVTGLDAGSYFVCFRTASTRGRHGYHNQCYTGQAWDGKTAPSAPRDTLVTVTAGHTHTGIKVILHKHRKHRSG